MPDAIILAGGRGERLKSVVSDVPKPLAPVNGVPFLDYLLEQLKAFHDITRVILAIGYKASQIKEYYKKIPISFPFSLIFSEEDENNPLGTGGALKKAFSLNVKSPAFIFNGDSFFDIDLQKMYHHHLQKKAELTIACRHVENVSRYGELYIDETMRIHAFYEKREIAKPGWINGGIYLIQPSLIKFFPEKICFSLEKEVFPELLNNPVFAYPSSGNFIDIGTKQSYFQAQRILQ